MVGLLAKPIIDLAVGNVGDHDVVAIRDSLTSGGWIHRGDAGSHGGYVFVLETRPSHRVAHLHVVEFGGPQWVNSLRLRDLLARPTSSGICSVREAARRSTRSTGAAKMNG